jgi:hypothetical protein
VRSGHVVSCSCPNALGGRAQAVTLLSPLEGLARRAAAVPPFPTSMAVASSYHCLTSSFLLVSSLILLSYFFAQFPHAPQGYSVHPSLASLGPETKTKDVYPEDYYSGGAYVSLPFGNVRLPLLFPTVVPIPILLSWQLCVPGPLLVIWPRIWKEGSESPFPDISILLNNRTRLSSFTAYLSLH